GSLLLYFPRGLLAAWGLYAGGPAWPARMAGALLVALALLLLLAAQERIVSAASMVAMLVANGLTALVLLIAYLQGEFAALGLVGQGVLVLLFLLCLISALTPLRFLRTDYVVL
ncbi:MAG TPA: hypothetical protein VNK95_00440, partial [Caldilineaceae bacterium]|nr:hypothetical protein [Caldilineaceae bacterium]